MQKSGIVFVTKRKNPVTFKRVDAIRESLGMNQKDFATAIGATKQAYGNWRKAGTVPAFYYDAICEVANISISDLYDESQTFEDLQWRKAGEKLKPTSRKCLIEFIDSLDAD